MPDILDSLSPDDLPAAGPDPQAGLADIRAADPGFDAGVFSDHARATFFAVKQAFDARDLSPIAGQLAAGTLATLQSQVANLIQAGVVHSFGQLSLDGNAIARAARGADYDKITVRFDARAVQSARQASNGQLVYGSDELVPFIEYWTFSRQAGSLTGAPAAPAHCANCGAPVTAGEGSSCTFCGAQLPPPAMVDWTVTAIQDPIDFDG